jgi:hypothetical protein
LLPDVVAGQVGSGINELLPDVGEVEPEVVVVPWRCDDVEDAVDGFLQAGWHLDPVTHVVAELDVLVEAIPEGVHTSGGCLVPRHLRTGSCGFLATWNRAVRVGLLSVVLVTRLVPLATIVVVMAG